MSDLATRRCVACEAGMPRLSAEGARQLLSEIPGWALVDEDKAIERTFSFKNYWETMAFVNAVAWIAHTEDHHPDLSVHWGRCVVRWNTHAVGGLTDNDFICAAKVNALLPA
ncbi:MAG: 4a-hydroxytetrahydrobiopterin dehydratase [Pseudomonadota bacterium]|nr:4a-hydroxytetrahydrobiopterin dehydratase [Pseudomonadota bacterium]